MLWESRKSESLKKRSNTQKIDEAVGNKFNTKKSTEQKDMKKSCKETTPARHKRATSGIPTVP